MSGAWFAGPNCPWLGALPSIDSAGGTRNTGTPLFADFFGTIMTALDQRIPPEPQALACAVIRTAMLSRGFAPPRGLKPAAQNCDLALSYYGFVRLPMLVHRCRAPCGFTSRTRAVFGLAEHGISRVPCQVFSRVARLFARLAALPFHAARALTRRFLTRPETTRA